MSIKEENTSDAAVAEAQSDKKAIKDMTKSELIEECQNSRAIWEFIPNDLQYFLSQIGKDCVFTDRMNKNHFGAYHGFDVEIKLHNLFSTDLRYDTVTHKPYVETGSIAVMASTITNFKFLDSRIEHIEES